jgi:hypothetical protein
MRIRSTRKRRGAVLPLVVVSLIGLIALTALAIDVGMIAVARTQVQNAADSAAMRGVRTLNGNQADNYRFDDVPGTTIEAATQNKVFSQNIQGDPNSPTQINDHTFESGQVKVEIGSYAYLYNDNDLSSEKFESQFPRSSSNEPYSAVRTTITYKGMFAFGNMFGMNQFDVGASAVAVHRPRDVVIIMDLSGSMRFQSLTAAPHGGSRTSSMNPEAVFPQFGHYSNVAAAKLQGNISISTGSGEMYDPANISVTTNSGPPIIEDFYQNPSGVSPGPTNRAFTRSPDSYATAPGGDNYLRTNNNTATNPYAATVNTILNGVSGKDLDFERKGYESYVSSFNGHTEGPGYWGKTFFIWPPDPRGSDLDANSSANHANNGAKDWRQRFFFKQNTSTGNLFWLDQNTILFDGNGRMRDPDTGIKVKENNVNITYRYKINYAAILHWLRNETPTHFPTLVKAGRIKYYDSIPDPSDTSLNNRWWTTSLTGMTNKNERFWREYIDFVLGLRSTGAGTYSNRYGSYYLSSMIGNGDRYGWGTFKLSAKPEGYQWGNINNSGGYSSGYSGKINVKNVGSTPNVGYYVRFGDSQKVYKITDRTVNSSGVTTNITLDVPLGASVSNSDTISFFTSVPRYMHYDDNPTRPKHHFWFGPMTFVDFLANYNSNRFWMPGNVHEAQCWACKVGIQTAIDDIKNNHPSDFIGLAFFSSPQYDYNGDGQHNKAIVPLGRSYQLLKDSLWFPPTTVTGTAKEITPYDSDFTQVPRAKGGTAPAMGFMIAYNLFSSSGNLRFYSQPQPEYRGAAGGLGRKGANRLIIFESDGAPNTRAFANLGGSGKDSYYKIRVQQPENMDSSKNVEWPSSGSYNDSELYAVASRICALDTANPPGYSTKRKPAEIHCIAYGSLFEPANSGSTQNKALGVFQTIHAIADPSKSSDASAFPTNYKIYGTNEERILRMQQAFTEIMQSGVQVSLVE